MKCLFCMKSFLVIWFLYIFSKELKLLKQPVQHSQGQKYSVVSYISWIMYLSCMWFIMYVSGNTSVIQPFLQFYFPKISNICSASAFKALFHLTKKLSVWQEKHFLLFAQAENSLCSSNLQRQSQTNPMIWLLSHNQYFKILLFTCLFFNVENSY